MKNNSKKLIVITIIVPIFIAIILKTLYQFYGNKPYDDDISSHVELYEESYNIVEINNIYYNYNKKILLSASKDIISDSIDWLYIDKRSYIMPFSRKNKRGFVDTQSGQVIISPCYDHAWVFREGLAAVSLNNHLFFIDSNDEIKIEGFDYVKHKDYYFDNGLSMAGKDSLVGLVDNEGNWVIDPYYTYIIPNEERESLMAFSPNHMISEFASNGSLLNKCIIRNASVNKFHNHSIIQYQSESGWYGLMDINGKFITDPIYKNFISVEDKILYLAESGKWGIMNSNGQILSKDIFESISEYRNY